MHYAASSAGKWSLGDSGRFNRETGNAVPNDSNTRHREPARVGSFKKWEAKLRRIRLTALGSSSSTMKPASGESSA